MNKITLLLLVIAFIAAAITFDWGGSRDYADSALESVSEMNNKLKEAGDKLSDVADEAGDMKKAAE